MPGINKCGCLCGGCACAACTAGNPCCVRIEFEGLLILTAWPALADTPLCNLGDDEISAHPNADVSGPYTVRWNGECQWYWQDQSDRYFRHAEMCRRTAIPTFECQPENDPVFRISITHVTGTTFRLTASVTLTTSYGTLLLYGFDGTFEWDCSETPVVVTSDLDASTWQQVHTGVDGCGYVATHALSNPTATVTAARCVCHCWAVWRSTVTGCTGTPAWTTPVHDRTILWDFGETDCPTGDPVPNDCDTGWILVNPCVAERYVRLTTDGTPTIGCDDDPDEVCSGSGTAPDPPTFDTDDCCDFICGCYAVFQSTVSGCPDDPVWSTPAFDRFDYRTGLEVFGGSFPVDSGWSTVDPCTAERAILTDTGPCALLTDCTGVAVPTYEVTPPADESPTDPEACCGQPCPDNCDECDDTITVTVSGFTGDCARYNGTWVMSRTGLECTWANAEGFVGILCDGTEWLLFPTDSFLWTCTAGVLNADGCPASGTYTMTGHDLGGAGNCGGQTATGIIA